MSAAAGIISAHIERPGTADTARGTAPKGWFRCSSRVTTWRVAMPRKTRGGVYRTRDGYGIRWQVQGQRVCRSGFRSEAEARAWFADNMLERVSGPLEKACQEIRTWAQRARWVWDTDSWVYVVAAPETKRIKIGLTVQPRNRLRELNTGSPVRLVPLFMVPGGKELESKLLEVTKPFAIPSAGTEWRTAEALEVVLTLVRVGTETGASLRWLRKVA